MFVGDENHLARPNLDFGAKGLPIRQPAKKQENPKSGLTPLKRGKLSEGAETDENIFDSIPPRE